MEFVFNAIRQSRANIIATVEGLTNEQLNEIPEGFSNNIAWNLGHILVTQQLLCYTLSGYLPKIPESIIEEFRKGTVPQRDYSFFDIQGIKKLLKESVEVLELDYNNNTFTEYKEYPTSYNVILTNIEDAIQFNSLHEGLHLGYIMALKKIISN